MVNFTTFLALIVTAGSVSAHWPSIRLHISLLVLYSSSNTILMYTITSGPNTGPRLSFGMMLSALPHRPGPINASSRQVPFFAYQAGQNLAAGTSNPSAATAIGWWNAESKDYNPSNPQYSHWTQVVWKSTTKPGCAMKQCAPGTIFDASYVANYFVCHYSPYGNVIGQF
ncbi:unnamed protein product, partial [Rhizoctonia solani]